MTQYQLSPFEVGQVKAHVEHGLSAAKIAERMVKADGQSTFHANAIQNCINKLGQQPEWRGGREPGSGRPRKTTAKQDNQIVKWVLKERGNQKVSVSRLQKQFPFLRQLSNTLVEERLFEAELEYLRRRNKSIVTKEYLEARVEYCQGVRRKHAATLEKLAYTDGTVLLICVLSRQPHRWMRCVRLTIYS
jgi:transposase